MRVFYFLMVELGHIPYRNMVMEHEGCTLYSSLIFNKKYFPYNTYSVLDFVLIEYFSLKVRTIGFHI